MLLRGLQSDPLGASGFSIIADSIIANNSASFGGGLACDSCRAMLRASVTDNTALRLLNNKTAPPTKSHSRHAKRNSSIGGSAVCFDDASKDPAVALMQHQVAGSGGAVAGNMAGSTFLLLCAGTAMRDNHAAAVGGALYINYTYSPQCAVPRPLGAAAPPLACFPGAGGFWPAACGVVSYNLDWRGSSAAAGGDVVAWTGAEGYSMLCSSSGGSASTACASGNSGGNSGSSSGGSSVTAGCVKQFSATSDETCLPVAGGNLSVLDAPQLKFTMPTRMLVYNTTCLQERAVLQQPQTSRALSVQACAVSKGAGGADFTAPRVFAGDAMNFTVRAVAAG